ncbi:MAG: APC family permease [Solirubrobacterales bacterium]
MATSTKPSAPSGGVFKRLLVGRAMSSHHLEHTLLPKVLALPVFASDALSSVAYATGEIFIQLTLVSLAFKGLVMPISIAIAALMSIVVLSYRQTVRAYPSGGGAYIVSKDNLGTLPGLIAAAALLVDYMMTVIVSIVAGVFAIGSALPWANDHRVLLSIFFVWFVTFANLRGARESGTIFAIPTYGFVVSILVMIVLGFGKCLGGCPTTQAVEPIHGAATAATTIGLFAVLKAFSSGATALTGVEAISNGVPAFRRPQARNAAETLAIMGVIAVTMFLGISWLATHVQGTVASDVRSVPAQIAWAVFGGGFGFYIVQFFTAAILILAANTAYQDFPRLSSILARDRFMPRQFMNRGDRLVFSNGIVVLALASSAMIYAFDASLTRLIQMYVIGVFMSFTLSQTGMVRHWLKEKHKGSEAAKGWKRSIVINIIGATATGIVLLVVTYTKFHDGGWLSMSFMAMLVVVFFSIHKHYTAIIDELRRGRVTVGGTGLNHAVLVVTGLDEATAEAVGYVRSIRPADLRAVFPTATGSVPMELQERWRRFAVGAPDLEALPVEGGDLLSAMRGFVHGIAARHRDFVTVVVPEVVRGHGILAYLVRSRSLVRLKAGLLREPNVVVADVPFPAGAKATVSPDGRPLIPQRTVALVFVSAIHDATIRAVNYAQSLEASETRAIYFDMDPEQEYRLEREWAEKGFEIPLDIVEAPFRDLTGPMLAEVRRFTRRPDTLVMVIIPELVLSKWRYMLLHNQNALFVKRLMLFEPQAVLASVPFSLELHG